MKLKKQFTTVTSFSKFLALTLFVALPFIGFWVGYQFRLENIEVRPQLLAANSTWQGDESLAKYYTFQIKYPANYFVTNTDMFVSYQSQGGVGFPTMVLTKNHQFTNPYPVDSEAFDELYRSKQDCILVFRGLMGETPGINNTEKSISGITLINAEESKNIGKYKAMIRKIKIDRSQDLSTEAYDGYLKINQDVDYYFQTCNLNNKADLRIVLDNFDIRGNL